MSTANSDKKLILYPGECHNYFQIYFMVASICFAALAFGY